LVMKGFKVSSDRQHLLLVASKERALTVIKVSFALKIAGDRNDFTVEMDRDIGRMVKDTTLAGAVAWVLAPFSLGLSMLGTAAGAQALYKQVETDVMAFIEKEVKAAERREERSG
jgi:hypothetical protein